MNTAPKSPRIQTGRLSAAGLIVSWRLFVLGEVWAICKTMRKDGFYFGALSPS